METSLHIRIVTTDGAFEALEGIWNPLLVSSEANTIFLTWEWIHTWWQAYQGGKELCVLVAEEKDVVIGIAPLYRARVFSFGIRARRHLEFIGSTGTCSEYLDFIIKRGCEDDVLRAMLHHLGTMPDGSWDVLNLCAMKEEAGNLGRCKNFFSTNNLPFQTYESIVAPYIALPRTMDAYLDSLDGKRRYKFRHCHKRLVREHDARLKRGWFPG